MTCTRVVSLCLIKKETTLLNHQKTKMMNKIKLFVLMAFALLFSLGIYAQEAGERGPRHRQGPNFEHLKEVLELTDEQSTALKPIFEDSKAKMQALRDQEFETREDRMKAAKAIMEAQREKVEAILSPEQVAKLKELHEERGPRRERGPQRARGMKLDQEQRQALHEELKAYHTQNILPLAKEQRAKLEAYISTEDKATLAELRSQKEQLHQHRKDARVKGERPERPSEEQRAAHKQHMETIKALVEKYDAQMEPLLAALKENGEEWRDDLKAIHEKHLPEGVEKRERGQKGRKFQGKRGQRGQQGEAGLHRTHEARPMFKKAQFLLLDPNADNTNNMLEESPFEMEAFPNPARSMANINFKVTQAGNVNIVLRNKSGNVSRVLFSGYRQEGDH